MNDNDERLINIEISLANCEKIIDELNDVIIEQGKKIDALVKGYKYIIDTMQEDGIKPLSEESPPPHY